MAILLQPEPGNMMGLGCVVSGSWCISREMQACHGVPAMCGEHAGCGFASDMAPRELSLPALDGEKPQPRVSVAKHKC